MNFHKNELIDEVNIHFFETYSNTLNVRDFVPEKHLKKIHAYIFKNYKKTLKRIDKEDKIYQKSLNPKPPFWCNIISFFTKKKGVK